MFKTYYYLRFVPTDTFYVIHQCLVLFLMIINDVNSYNESAQYLQNAVRDLRKLKLRRADTAMVSAAAAAVPPQYQEAPVHPQVERRVRHGDEVPPISLTKGELAALYEAAVSKGETLKLDTGDNTYINTAVHELDSSENQEGHNYDLPKDHHDETSGADASGYYYYYYPIKSFIDEMSSQPSGSANEYIYKPSKPRDVHPTISPQYQYHSHHHQHNITINKAMMEDKKPNKSLEPLFMAISGFIGMAVMFVLSVLVLPKFGIKPKTQVLGKKNDKIEDFARFAMDAIDSGHCAERFACELSKTARAFNLQDNRFVKLLKRLAPGTFGKHIDRAGKYSSKQLKCTAIPCKKKNNNGQKKKNAQKKH